MGHRAAALVRKLVSNFGHLVSDDFSENNVVVKNRLEANNLFTQLNHFVIKIASAKSRQATKRHVQDVLRLFFRETKGVTN